MKWENGSEVMVKENCFIDPALSVDCDHWKRADACRKLKMIRKQEGEIMKTLDFFKTMAWLASTTTLGSRGIPGEANYFFDHGAEPFVDIRISMNDLFTNKFMLAGGFDHKKGIPVMTHSQDRFHLHEMKFIKYEFIHTSQKLLRRRRSLKPHTKKSFAYRNHWFKN